MAPAGKGGGGEPSGALADAIKKTFGDFAKFKEQLASAATSRFGGGWPWPVLSGGKLEGLSTGKRATPLMGGKIPGPALDGWDHGHHLKYQNRRPGQVPGRRR